ncbi:MAG: glycosyltransferase family 4 protein [Anaerolineales bacterium]|nr:glycosyltransferase family 4 protein [Anaerolineales bacterium]
MKILYNLSYPGDRLDVQRAGHIVRANAILNGLEALGHTVIRIEAAEDKEARLAVSTYQNLIKNRLPSSIALKLRDVGRVVQSRRYTHRLIEAIEHHRPDCILETHVPFNLAGKLASDKTGTPLIIDDVAPVWEEEQQYGVGFKSLAQKTYQQVANRANLLIAVNKTLKKYLLEQGLPEKKILVVENGIDGLLFNPLVDGRKYRAQYGFREDEVVLVFVGSFQPYHRVDFLLNAFANIVTKQPARLLFVGDGNHRPEAEVLAKRLGLADKTVFTGRIPYDEVSAYAAAGDIAVMPATNEYGNPMKVYEYMALGKAVIAPNQDTITEIAKHNQNAYLFEPENVQSLGLAIQMLIDDANLRRILSENAGKLASSFTWQTRAKVLEQAILKII